MKKKSEKKIKRKKR